MRTGNLLYTAGHIPIKPDGTITTGKVRGGTNLATDKSFKTVTVGADPDMLIPTDPTYAVGDGG